MKKAGLVVLGLGLALGTFSFQSTMLKDYKHVVSENADLRMFNARRQRRLVKPQAKPELDSIGTASHLLGTPPQHHLCHLDARERAASHRDRQHRQDGLLCAEFPHEGLACFGSSKDDESLVMGMAHQHTRRPQGAAPDAPLRSQAIHSNARG